MFKFLALFCILSGFPELSFQEAFSNFSVDSVPIVPELPKSILQLIFGGPELTQNNLTNKDPPFDLLISTIELPEDFVVTNNSGVKSVAKGSDQKSSKTNFTKRTKQKSKDNIKIRESKIKGDPKPIKKIKNTKQKTIQTPILGSFIENSTTDIDDGGIEMIHEKSSNTSQIRSLISCGKKIFGKYDLSSPEPLNPSQVTGLTHLILYSINFESNGTLISSIPQIESDNFQSALNISKSFESLKVLISIGGWEPNSQHFKAIVADPETRRVFATNLASFLADNNLDGVLINWIYPNDGEMNSKEDRDHYFHFIKDLRKVFRSKYEIAFTGNTRFIEDGYYLHRMLSFADWVLIKAYEYNGLWSEVRSPLAPLYGNNGSNLNHTISNYLSETDLSTRSQLILDLPFYVKAWNGMSTKNSVDKLGFEQITNLLNAIDFTYTFDTETKTPSLESNDTYISYEDPQSIIHKMEFAKSRGLGGIFIDRENDDPRQTLFKAVENFSFC